MSEPAIRAAIKAIVESVTNVGAVHDYERWSAEYTAVSDVYWTTINGARTLRGCSISCNQIRPESQILTGDRAAINRINYQYKIRMYFGLQDAAASEKTALALAISVMNALDAGGSLEAIPAFPELAQLDIFEARMYTNALVHYAEITQRVTEYV